MNEQKNQNKKMPAGTICAIIVFSIFAGLVMYSNEQKRQEKYDAAYENSMKLSQDMREFGWGLIDSENLTLSYDVPDGYIYSEQNSTDNSKMFIAEDGSRVICVSFKKTDKKYTEADIDQLISNNMGSGYTKSAESYRNYDFYVYKHSENSEDENEVKPVCVSTYVSVPDGCMICVDDILYGEEKNSQDVTKLLNSMFYYETSEK